MYNEIPFFVFPHALKTYNDLILRYLHHTFLQYYTTLQTCFLLHNHPILQFQHTLPLPHQFQHSSYFRILHWAWK